jgi:hypothetical protein
MQSLLILPILLKAAGALMKEFSKAASSHMNSLLKATEVDNFCGICKFSLQWLSGSC